MIVHILAKEQNGVQLILEVQFIAFRVEEDAEVVENGGGSSEEIYLSDKVMCIRPYITASNIEERFTFPPEIERYNLRHAHQVMVLALNAVKIDGENFFANINYALENSNLAEINRWLGKNHSIQEIKEMLDQQLPNFLFNPLFSLLFSNNTNPDTLRIIRLYENRSFRKTLTERLQQAIKTA